MHLIKVEQNKADSENTLTNHLSNSTSAMPSPISVNLKGIKVLFVCVANTAACFLKCSFKGDLRAILLRRGKPRFMNAKC